MREGSLEDLRGQALGSRECSGGGDLAEQDSEELSFLIQGWRKGVLEN